MTRLLWIWAGDVDDMAKTMKNTTTTTKGVGGDIVIVAVIET